MLRLQTNVGTSVVLAVLVSLAPRLDAAGPNSSLPFPRTEERQPCNNFVATKQPFFGETHLHTAYSFDAVTLDTRNTPKDAYRYAKGEAVGLPPWADTRTGTEPSPPDAPTLVTEHPYCMPGEHCEFMATRTIQFPEGRALDFAAITDHAEQFGESNICEFEATQTCGDDSDCPVAAGQKCISGMCRPEGYDSDTCLSARQEVSRLRSDPIASLFAGLENVPEAVSRPDFCGEDGSICTKQAKLVWDQIQQDAEEAYDRSDACTFTSFVAYEYTAMAVSGRCGTSSSPSADGPPCWQDEDCPARTGVPLRLSRQLGRRQSASQRHLPERRRHRPTDQQRRETARLWLQQPVYRSRAGHHDAELPDRFPGSDAPGVEGPMHR